MAIDDLNHISTGLALIFFQGWSRGKLLKLVIVEMVNTISHYLTYLMC